tara:strand:- start:4029 stop:6500 length:2472 start_codon:yes stop_codon:yes gene_type:complete
MNERDRLIEKLIKEKGGTKEQYLQLLNSVAYHESARTLDPKTKQKGGGPGRGKYQFEAGKHAGGITAAKRTKNYYKDSGERVPEWIDSISKQDDLDATTLTDEQQDVLFLGNIRKHPKADLKNLWEGKQDVPEFWANYHWSGKSKDRPKRLRNFKEDFKSYNTKQREIAEVQANPNPNQRVEVEKDGVNLKQPQVLDQIMKAYGGGLEGIRGLNKNLNSFEGGGTHEQNSLGGIPQGKGKNGKLNTVEEGETSFNLDSGKFIFTNRFGMGGMPKLKDKGSLSFADGGPIDPPNTAKKMEGIESDAKWTQDWFKAPETAARYSMNTKQGFGKSLPQLDAAVNRIGNLTYNLDAKSDNKNAGAQYNKDGHSIDYYKEPNSEINVHEMTHGSQLDSTMDKVIGEKWGKPAAAVQKKHGADFNTSLAKAFSIKGQGTFMGDSNIEDVANHSRYMSSGKELYPRIMQMRKVINAKPGQVINDGDIQKIKENLDNDDMFKFYSDKQIKEMLNTLASNTTGGGDVNMAANGGKLEQGCGGPGQPPCEPKKETLNDLYHDPLNQRRTFDSGYNFLNNWVNDPEFEKRLNKNVKDFEPRRSGLDGLVGQLFGEDSPEERAQKLKKGTLDQFKSNKTFSPGAIPSRADVGYKKQREFNKNAEEFSDRYSKAAGEDKYSKLVREVTSSGIHYPHNNTNYIAPSHNKEGMNSTYVHEKTHSTPLDNYYSYKLESGNVISKEYDALVTEGTPEAMDKLDALTKKSKYLNNSTEVYPRLMEIRYENNIKPGEIIDDTKLKKIKEKGSRLFEIYDDEQIKTMLNTLASTTKKKNNKTA